VASWLAKLINNRGVILGIAAAVAAGVGLHLEIFHGAGLWDG
jgi:hypothetical protein